MSLVNLAHVCSHLQNASRARLGMTSIPLSNLHLRLAQQMHKAGFFGSVTIAGQHQPPQGGVFGTHPAAHTTYKTTIPAHYKPNPAYTPRDALTQAQAPQLLGEEVEVDNEPYLFVPEETSSMTVDESAVTKYTVATRRLWLGMKYWDNRPVIETMRLISKPTRRIWAPAEALDRLARGNDWGMVRGARQVGECIFLTTDRGVLEIRECVERGIGGMLLLRVW